MKFDGTNLNEVLEAHFRWAQEIPDEDGLVHDEWRADFTDANLRHSTLPGVYLYGAILRGTDLSYADLTDATLTNSDMTGASLFHTRLEGANLHNIKGMPYVPMLCPSDGSFTAWKKCIYRYADGTLGDKVIVKMIVPEDAQRASDTNRECRADKVDVIEIQTLDGKTLIDRNTDTKDCAVSIKDKETRYIPGRTTYSPVFGDRCWQTYDCHFAIDGIFFYINRQEAVEYMTCGRDKDGNLIDIRDRLQELTKS